MADEPIRGSFETLTLDDGTQVPWYLVEFGKDGNLKSPQIYDDLVRGAREGDFTDVFLFSHGWNNDFPTATGRYRDFFQSFAALRRDHGLSLGRDYRPLLVGVVWPSTILVLPGERPPELAAADDGTGSLDPATARDVDEIAGLLDAEGEAALRRLAAVEELDQEGINELAALLAPLYGRGNDPFDDVGGEDDLTARELKALWRDLEPAAPPAPAGDGGLPGFADGGGGPAEGPEAAGFLSALDPRKAIRVFTVYQMKDRAGRVGAAGVGPLVRDLKGASGGRLHLIGHSFGAKVVLSALASGALPGDGQVHSVLLLQPAVNGWCFAEDVDGEGFSGRYRPVRHQVRLPILTTFTEHDAPLTKFFHLALRRKRDLGERGPDLAADAPSRYGALGGFGPQGLEPPEHLEIEMPAPGSPYPLRRPGLEILALRGHHAIDGHGGIIHPHSAWALWSCVAEDGGRDA
ncbi:MAG: hypothetical protein AAGD06_27945 [Acidobacteriota bacterium]